MARIRSTHPGQWTSGDFLECSPLARLLALALRNVADDHGAFRWKPTTIKAECLPGDNCEIAALLEELVRNNQIIKYAVDGKEYGLIKDFTQWQRPKKPKYVHPVPPEFSPSTGPVPNEDATEPEILPQRKEVGGRRDEVKESSPTPAKPQARANDDFDRFKAAYPRRDGSNPWQPAEKKFKALVKTGVDPEVMITAAAALAREEGARGNIGTKFIPQALTWLNQQRFHDYAAQSFSISSDDGMVEVLGEEELAAWDAHARAKGGKSYPRNSRGGWRFPSRWPPGYVPSSSAAVERPPQMRTM